MKQVYIVSNKRLPIRGLWIALFYWIATLQPLYSQCTAPPCVGNNDDPSNFSGYHCGTTGIYGPYYNSTGEAIAGTPDGCTGAVTVGVGGSYAVNGSLEIQAVGSLTVESGGVAHIFGNIYNMGTIDVQTGGTLYFYGDQWINGPGATVNGVGTIHFYNPRPAPDGMTTIGGFTRPVDIDNGFAAATSVQCFDAGSITMQPNFVFTNPNDINFTGLTYTFQYATNPPSIAAGADNAGFGGQATFGIDGTRLWLNNNTITMTSAGTFANCGPDRFVVTNGTGTLTKTGLDASIFLFPVGPCDNDYAPAQITDGVAGADDYAVRVQNDITNPPAPSVVPNVTAPDEGPGRYWNITSPSSTLMTLDLQHNKTTGEGTTYASSDNEAYITRNIGATSGTGITTSFTNWDRTGTFVNENTATGTLQCAAGPITGTGVLSRTFTGSLSTNAWYSKTYDHITPFGNSLQVNPIVFLQGSYSGTMMTTTLNSAGILQASATAQPYSGTPFSYAGTETVGTGFFAANPNITDWVLVELRDATTPATVVATRAVFVKKDGTIVDIDGKSPVAIQGLAAGNYHIAIRHRNHLGILTSSAQVFAINTTTAYDFTTAQSQAYQDGTITSNAAMVNLGGGKFGMWGGDANPDDQVYDGNDPDGDVQWILNNLLSGDPSLFLLNTYSIGDVNMDGQVYDGNDPDGDIQWLINNVLGAIPSNFTLRHFP